MKTVSVTVVGGGIAGCTAAIELSKNKQYKINLYEKKSYILGNAPYCRLHCGLMYPMISFKESELLLRYSIDFANEYPTAIFKRPCVIMYNAQSNYSTVDLVNKCNFIKLKYGGLVRQGNPLGTTASFFAAYTKNDIIHFKNTGEFLYSTCEARKFHDPYVKTVCKMLKDINSIKYPFVSVNEFGIEQDIVEQLIKHKIKNTPNIKLHLETEYRGSSSFSSEWGETCSLSQTAPVKTPLINAKGHSTSNCGLLELKSSWLVSSSSQYTIPLPEIAIIGERGTSQGMIQLSPRKNGKIQLHYMSSNSTLFQRVSHFSEFTLENQKIIINNCIPDDITIIRTNNAIKQINKFLDTSLELDNCKALWGCQFIPNKVDTLRTSTYTFKKSTSNEDVLREGTQKLEIDIEIVKAISSIYTAKQISKIIDFKLY
jgi:hypothetical protein